MKFKHSPPGCRNVRGPLIQNVQAKLNAAGYDAGSEDGLWGPNTVNALKAWQQQNGLQPNGEIDDATWNGLIGEPIPGLFERALQLTGDWEGTGYTGTNGNFDGMGITWGVVGFTWGNGELQRILEEIRSSHPQVFATALGDLEQEMVSVLGRPLPSQMTWAQSISINRGDAIAAPWASAFKELGSAPEVQQIENQHAQHYWNAGAQIAADFDLTSEAGQALCFDIAVQNTLSHGLISEIQERISAPDLTETDKMGIIAHAIASHALPRYYNDVLTRKMTFVTGRGAVHGDQYDITCWGIG